MSVNQETNSVQKIDLSPNDYKKRIRRLKIEFILVVTVYNLVLFFYGKATIITIGCFLGFNSIALFVWINFFAKLRGASITNDMMILKNTKDQTQVTSIRSVSVLHDKRILKNHFSKVQYRLDGTKYKAFILCDSKCTKGQILNR